MPELEKRVKDDIKELLKELDAWQYMPVQTGYGARGIPDHIACIPLKITEDHVGQTLGIFVGIEAKQLGKTPTAIQMNQLTKIFEAGGGAFVIDGTSKEAGSYERVRNKLYRLFKQRGRAGT